MKRFIILLIAVSCGITAFGQKTFEVDGINYRIIKEADESSTFGTVSVCPKQYGKYEDDIVIPNAVKQGNDQFSDQYKIVGIDPETFANCEDLESVTLSPSIEVIGENAFYNSSIKKIVIPYGNLKTISERVFYCSRIQSVSLPASVTEIGAEAFAYSAINDFKADGIIMLGNGAFASSSIENVQLPNSLVSIGDYTFNYCKRLQSIVIPESVKSIGTSAFQECDKLAEINLPEGIKEIKEMAFNHSGIISISVPSGISKIEEGVFSCCFKLRHVILPSSIKRIGNYAFSACTSLHSIIIPENIKNISDGAFYQCSELEALYIKASTPPTMGDMLFKDANPNVIIYVPASLKEQFKNSESWGQYAKFVEQFDYTKGDPDVSSYKVTKVKPQEYAGYEGTSITIEKGIEEIGSAAFYKASIESITLPSTLKKIGSSAFYLCEKLKSVNIPDSVDEIGHGAFADCSNLKSISIPKGISSIDKMTFSGCKSLENVVIPSTVDSIGNDSFQNCEALEKIIIPEGVTYIGERAFDGCKKLKTVVLPSTLKEIGERAFGGCESITELVLPESIKKVGRFAFGDCSQLTSVRILGKVSEWGISVFVRCDNIKSIELSENLSEVNPDTFYGVIDVIRHSAGGGTEIQAIDLGLSIKWGSQNIGSEFPERIGSLFAWGETASRENFSEDNYALSKDGKYLKYCLENQYGQVDGLSILKSEDDAATKILGKGWRMPTVEEFKELAENCEWKYVTDYSRKIFGFVVTGPSGNSIFIPCQYDWGRLWSSSIGNSFLGSTPWGRVLEFREETQRAKMSISNCSRDYGLPIRPVKE